MPTRDQENMNVDSLAKRIASDIDVLSDLPSPSPVVARLSATLGDDDVEVRTIEAIIGQDPVVAGKVIHAANAAAYASHTPTASIRAALLRLGVIGVRRLAMLFGLFNAYPGPRVPEGFWQHSLAVAQLTDVVVQHMTAGEMPTPTRCSSASAGHSREAARSSWTSS
jgi:HD-like signal output (HDOD) protein